MQDILKNEEISTIINTVGAGVGQDFDPNESNYGKIVIMTDADTDGAHIQVLLRYFFLSLYARVNSRRKSIYCFTSTV